MPSETPPKRELKIRMEVMFSYDKPHILNRVPLALGRLSQEYQQKWYVDRGSQWLQLLKS